MAEFINDYIVGFNNGWADVWSQYYYFVASTSLHCSYCSVHVHFNVNPLPPPTLLYVAYKLKSIEFSVEPNTLHKTARTIG